MTTPRIEKRYQVMRSGILFVSGGEINVSIHENTYGRQWFASQEQFQDQVASGLIIEIERLPSES